MATLAQLLKTMHEIANVSRNLLVDGYNPDDIYSSAFFYDGIVEKDWQYLYMSYVSLLFSSTQMIYDHFKSNIQTIPFTLCLGCNLQQAIAELENDYNYLSKVNNEIDTCIDNKISTMDDSERIKFCRTQRGNYWHYELFEEQKEILNKTAVELAEFLKKNKALKNNLLDYSKKLTDQFYSRYKILLESCLELLENQLNYPKELDTMGLYYSLRDSLPDKINEDVSNTVKKNINKYSSLQLKAGLEKEIEAIITDTSDSLWSEIVGQCYNKETQRFDEEGIILAIINKRMLYYEDKNYYYKIYENIDYIESYQCELTKLSRKNNVNKGAQQKADLSSYPRLREILQQNIVCSQETFDLFCKSVVDVQKIIEKGKGSIPTWAYVYRVCYDKKIIIQSSLNKTQFAEAMYEVLTNSKIEHQWSSAKQISNNLDHSSSLQLIATTNKLSLLPTQKGYYDSVLTIFDALVKIVSTCHNN